MPDSEKKPRHAGRHAAPPPPAPQTAAEKEDELFDAYDLGVDDGRDPAPAKAEEGRFVRRERDEKEVSKARKRKRRKSSARADAASF